MREARAKISRRRALQLLAGGLGAGAAGLVAPRRGSAAGRATRRFLIVITGTGGASILDSVLARRSDELADNTLNSFPEQQLWRAPGSPLSAVDLDLPTLGPIPFSVRGRQQEFVSRYREQIVAFPYTGTSVNHLIAGKRALTGNDAWGGRTIQEAVAAHHGQPLLLPNVNMGIGGYGEDGHDGTLPAEARGVLIGDPLLWPFGLHGHAGISGAGRPTPALIDRMRSVRDGSLTEASRFSERYRESAQLRRWRQLRDEVQPELEAQRLISELNFIPDSPSLPLDDFGIGSSADSALLRETFPNFLSDPFEAQACLAYLLLTRDVSASVTIGPRNSPGVTEDGGLTGPPIAFDFSHTDHRATQAFMWSRLFSVADRLIRLLSAVEFHEGESYWDRSLVYCATEFGRTRQRPAGSDAFGSGHHLNNGALLISPLLQGDQVLGGVDEQGMCYGADPSSGRPEPGREFDERDLFGALTQVMGVDTAGAGLPTFDTLLR